MEETDGERLLWVEAHNSIPAASQLHGRGPLLWMMPVHLHVNLPVLIYVLGAQKTIMI